METKLRWYPRSNQLRSWQRTSKLFLRYFYVIEHFGMKNNRWYRFTPFASICSEFSRHQIGLDLYVAVLYCACGRASFSNVRALDWLLLLLFRIQYMFSIQCAVFSLENILILLCFVRLAFVRVSAYVCVCVSEYCSRHCRYCNCYYIFSEMCESRARCHINKINDTQTFCCCWQGRKWNLI